MKTKMTKALYLGALPMHNECKTGNKKMHLKLCEVKINYLTLLFSMI